MPFRRSIRLAAAALLVFAAASARADDALSKQQAADLVDKLWDAHVAQAGPLGADALNSDSITVSIGNADRTMKFMHRTLGTKPAKGWDLWLVLHGGGGAPKELNDQQWSGMVNLYSPDDALVIAPRAPADAWDMWHQAQVDDFYDALISRLVAAGKVNPDRVYLIGYSAGGDGVYQLAPRLADRFAAAGMMAGHPNETVPLGLRNIGFALHVGALDSAYNRNGVAAQWKQWLADLRRNDPDGYANEVQLHEGRQHWMNREEHSALKFMRGFTRDALPKKVVWKQDDVTHDRFYWLAVPKGEAKERTLIIARRDGQTFDIDTADGVSTVTLLLNDTMADLDKPIVVRVGGVERFNGLVKRSADTITRTFAERGDKSLVFSASLNMKIESQRPAVQVPTDLPWSASVPAELVSGYVLPNTSVAETDEDWRSVLTPIARDLVNDKPTIREAAMALNAELFKRVKVEYHPTKRSKPDQSPGESMKAGFASCTGLSILLVDACRSVGIPARIVGTPEWATHRGDANGNHGGNHTWVEIWDGHAWRFLGASEPGELDQTWFNDNASKADSSVFDYGIYAVGATRDSSLHFPMIWNRGNQSIPGIDVSDYYAHRSQVTFTLPEGATATLRDTGRLVGSVSADHATIPLAGGRLYTATLKTRDGKETSTQFTLSRESKQDVSLDTK